MISTIRTPLPSAEELLADDRRVAAQAQISQEPLQGAAYRLRDTCLPSAEELLADDRRVAAQAQISQEPLQGAAYRLRGQK
jgi:hypothetical protein